MKVLFTSEDGVYLDFKAATSLFSKNSEFHEYDNLEGVFSTLDLDPNAFAVAKLNDSINGDNENLLEYLFRKKYKVFAEIYFIPEYHLYYSHALKHKKLQKVYLEPITYEFIQEFVEKNKELEFVKTRDMPEIIEANPIEIACVVTHDFTRSNNLKFIKKDLKLKQKPKVRYIVIGRAFYDLPSDDADKVILICKFDKKIKEEEILQVIEKGDLTLFRICKNQKTEFNEYYLEIGFHGLPDLYNLEKMAKEMNILGIIESGKVIRL